MTLAPPAVEPADPPTTISIKRINVRKEAIFPLSHNQNQVVMILETWKKEISKLFANISIKVKAIVGNQYAR